MSRSEPKRCPHCGKWKEVAEFYSSKGKPASWCQDCVKERSRERYAAIVGGTKPKVKEVRAKDARASVTMIAPSYDTLAAILGVTPSAVRNAASRGSLVLDRWDIEEVRER